VTQDTVDGPRTQLPRWVFWLDGAALGSLLLGITLRLSPAQHVRFDVPWGTLSLGDAWRPLLAAALLAGVRHALYRRPHLLDRVLAARHRLSEPSVRMGLRMLVTTRLPVLIIGYAATLLIGLAPTVRSISDDPLANLPSRWDAAWYMDIARVGYEYRPGEAPGHQYPIVFFPLYPMATRTLAAFTTPERTAAMDYEAYLEMRQVHLVWCGTVLSLLAFAAAVMVIYRWAEQRAGADAAGSSVALLAAYPFGVFFSAAYTESLFLLLAAGACYAFEKGRLPIAAAAGLLAGLTRPNGVMLSIPLMVLALSDFRRHETGGAGRLIRRLLVAGMPAAGLLLYSAFLYGLTGDPLAWVEAQAAWGRDRGRTLDHYVWIWRTVRAEGVLAYVGALPAEALQMTAVAFALGLVVPVWRRVGPAYALFMLASLLPPLVQGGLLSAGRFTAVLFPMFLALALLLPPARRTAWMLAFAIGQGFVAAIFFTGRPIY
jgi:hypothetical protein